MLLPLRRQKRSPKQPSRSYLPKDLSGENGIVATTIQLRRAAIPWLVPLQFASNDSPTVSCLPYAACRNKDGGIDRLKADEGALDRLGGMSVEDVRAGCNCGLVKPKPDTGNVTL